MKILVSLFVTLFVTQQSASPRQVADDLLNADRAFAASAAKTDLIAGISATFAPHIVMPAPGGVIAGADKVIDALKANPANVNAKVSWTPARVGVSADGKHGFTAGFMTVTRADGTVTAAKYMAYWEKQKDGWRARAYKRGAAKTTPASVTPSYVLPARIVTSAAISERDRESLADAERSFSKDAQTMGLGAAFKKYGSPEAMNLGGANVDTFILGNDAIGDAVGEGLAPNTSPVTWGPDMTIIAPSGDFGVTIGYITRKAAGPDGKIPPPNPFFTIWRRDSPSAPWRYIAE